MTAIHGASSRRRHAAWLWFLALLFGAWATGASASPVQQIVQLKASDGRAVPALITYPDGGPDSGAPIAIFHHGGPGGHPLRALGAGRWGADYFARHGYITITLLSRISRDLFDQPFGAGVADIKGVVDWASQLSAGPIVLVGHSSGSVSNTLYMAQTNDPRVKAIVHFAPTGGGSEWMIRNMGEVRYASVVARLRALVAEGHGDQPVYEDHHLAPPAPASVTYGYLMSARTWLSWWGPESLNRNIALFPRIRVPMLMISGDADIFVSRQYQDQLRAAATASPRVDGIVLAGGVPHEFTGSETRAATLAFDWLADVGIRPTPRVTTRVVDLKIGGEVRPGVIYEPTDASARKPVAVMMMPDFADDVLLSPLDAIGPRLAKAGYTVLIPQDRGSGWNHYRAVAADVSADQRAWLTYLADQGHPRVAVIAHGFAGVMAPALLISTPLTPKPMTPTPPTGASAGAIAGVALIQPPVAPAQFARDALGADEYAGAVDQARAAVSRGDGGTAMIIVGYRAHPGTPTGHQWIMHMAAGFLSFWGPLAPAAPIPTLAAAGRPVLLIDAGKGRFLARDAQTGATGRHLSSRWYTDVASPFDAPDRLIADLTAWLDGLAPATTPGGAGEDHRHG